MRPNSRRHDEYAPHPRRAATPPQAPAQGPAQPSRGRRARRKRTTPQRPEQMIEQRPVEVPSQAEVAIEHDESVVESAEPVTVPEGPAGE